MKNRLLPLLLAFLLTLSGCGAPADGKTELSVFAAASLTEVLDRLVEQYQSVAPDVKIVPTYDSSGTLLQQMEHGAACDLFLSAAQKQMDALEETGALLEGTRTDLLENKIVLAVPGGNPGNINSFDRLAQRLAAGDVLLAVGNSDVPVGQYTQNIFTYYGLDEAALAASGVLTYGSNVKEISTQVSEGIVDCGIIYATDAISAGLTTVDAAAPEVCGRAVYPAAVLADSASPDAARAFLDYLRSEEAQHIFTDAGFTAIQ